jgi:GNAT superfamily N-acetyltransferase
MIATIIIRALQDNELEVARALLVESFIEDPTIAWMLQKNEDGFKERVKIYVCAVHRFYVDMQMPITGAFLNNDLKGVVYGGYFGDADIQQASHRWNQQIKTNFSGATLERVFYYEESMHDEILPNTYLLGLIAVDEKTRGQGIGTALIKEIIGRCQSKPEIKRIMLDTANQRNISLYEKLGFKTVTVKALSENFCETVMAYNL